MIIEYKDNEPEGLREFLGQHLDHRAEVTVEPIEWRVNGLDSPLAHLHRTDGGWALHITEEITHPCGCRWRLAREDEEPDAPGRADEHPGWVRVARCVEIR